jgi:hypothetical protein
VALSNPHDPGMYMMKWHLNLFRGRNMLVVVVGLDLGDSEVQNPTKVIEA